MTRPDPKPWIYDDNYLVYCDGKIYSKCSGKFLKQWLRNNQYFAIRIRPNNNNTKWHNLLVHRMVATMFCENPDNKNIVDHIDRNSQNNNYTNLRWSTQSENTKNRDYYPSKSHSNCIKIQQLAEDDTILAEFNSQAEASRITKIPYDDIKKCCTNLIEKTYYNGTWYKWRYLNYKKPEKSDIPENSVMISGYKCYYITNDGRLYSSHVKRFLTLREKNGYYTSVSLSGKTFLIHCLVAEAFIYDKPYDYKNMQINHKDGNKRNNHVSNLEYTTISQNMIHKTYNLVQKNCITIRVKDNQGNIIEFPSARKAAESSELAKGYMAEKYRKFLNKNPDKIPTLNLFKKQFPGSKQVEIMEKISGKKLVFPTIKDTAKYLGLCSDSISRYCHNKRTHSLYDFSFI